MTDDDKGINTLHFGSDPADTWIWINPDLNPGSLLDEATKGQGPLAVGGGIRCQRAVCS